MVGSQDRSLSRAFQPAASGKSLRLSSAGGPGGWRIIRQAPTDPTIDFIQKLGPLGGKQAAVFTTYAIAIGKTLEKMAGALEGRVARVTGKFKSKGPSPAGDFATWLRRLEA